MVDHYAGAAGGWAEGAALVYAPIARALVDTGPRDLRGRTVLDVGAGTGLPVDAVDDTVCAFVLNHLTDPGAGLHELARVTRPGGAVLACVFANAGSSEAREVLDEAALAEGWVPPDWYLQLRTESAPLLGTTQEMARAAAAAGLTRVQVAERPVDVGVTEPEQLVAYRLGQANFAPWVNALGPRRTAEITARLVERVRPVMAPYRPVVVFLSAFAPA